jgi:hypothetical protein
VRDVEHEWRRSRDCELPERGVVVVEQAQTAGG